MAPTLWLTGDQEADALLGADPNALLLGMVLDQQVPMEKAFSGPAVIAQRMDGRLDLASIAAMDEEAFVALCSERPAIHRFPGAMGKRVRQVARVVTDDYHGDATRLWASAQTGEELKAALGRLPGFGAEKATIFVALLGKQCGVTPAGWREAAAPYGEDGTYLSVADVRDPDSLARVRESKRAAKAATKAATSKKGAAKE